MYVEIFVYYCLFIIIVIGIITNIIFTVSDWSDGLTLWTHTHYFNSHFFQVNLSYVFPVDSLCGPKSNFHCLAIIAPTACWHTWLLTQVVHDVKGILWAVCLILPIGASQWARKLAGLAYMHRACCIIEHAILSLAKMWPLAVFIVPVCEGMARLT